MRRISHILFYTLLSASVAQAGPFSRGVRSRRAAPAISPDPENIYEVLSPAVQARKEEDNGVAPSPIFSTIVPDAPETASSLPESPSEDPNSNPPEAPLTTTQLPELDDILTTTQQIDPPIQTTTPSPEPPALTTTPSPEPPILTTSPRDEPGPSTRSPSAAPESQQPNPDAPQSSSEEVFLPPISSTISLPEELLSTEVSEILQPTASDELPGVEPSSAFSESEVPALPTSASSELEPTESVPETTAPLPAPSDDGNGDQGGAIPSPIFSTISADPVTTEESLSLASTLTLPVGQSSSEGLDSTSLEVPNASGEPVTSLLPESDIVSSTETFPGGPILTTTVGIPSPSEDRPPPPPESDVSSPVPESEAPFTSETPVASTSTEATSSTPEITPTGQPDDQVPTNRGPANPEATESVSPDIFQINLRHAQAYHERFKSLNEDSACAAGQVACIDGKIARCNADRGGFDLEACSDGTSCFPLPLVFEDGVSLNCADPAEARRILGVEGEDEGPPADDVITTTTTPTVTEVIATETVERPGESPPPEDDVVTVTETPTVTEVIATETLEGPGGVETTSTDDEDGDVTTTVRDTLTLTTVITVDPPAPLPTTPDPETHYVTVTVTAEPSEGPSESTNEPSPTPSGDAGNDNGNDGDDGDGDEGDGDDQGSPTPARPDPRPSILTSLDIIFLPTTFVTTTISTAEPAANVAPTLVDAQLAQETLTVTETISVPFLITVTQHEVRIQQETIVSTVTLLAG